jgi:hypothetical protein
MVRIRRAKATSSAKAIMAKDATASETIIAIAHNFVLIAPATTSQNLYSNRRCGSSISEDALP